MNGAFLFQWVLSGPDKAESVAALNDVALCRLTGWLAQDYQEDGPTGDVLGICLVEQARRFTARLSRPPEGGTTNGEGFL